MPIFAYIIFAIIALVIVVMGVISFMYHNVKKFREEAEDRYYRNLKRKEQKEKNPFGEDYFKSSNSKQNSRRQQGQYASRPNSKTSQTSQTNQTSQTQTGNTSNPREEEETTARKKTTTDSGVTILDERSEDKKIFTHDDGEYVEFEEVR